MLTASQARRGGGKGWSLAAADELELEGRDSTEKCMWARHAYRYAGWRLALLTGVLTPLHALWHAVPTAVHT